jgi:hypothetical protein
MYRYRIQRGVIPSHVTFASAMRDDGRILQNSAMGSNLERFLERFAPSQFHYVFFDDIRGAPQQVVDALCGFLEVDSFTPEGMTERVNETGAPRFPLLARGFRSGLLLAKRLQAGHLIHALKGSALGRAVQRRAEATVPATSTAKPDAEAVALVADRFEEEIGKLETITGRDLAAWRTRLAEP